MRLVNRAQRDRPFGWLEGSHENLIDAFFGPIRLAAESNNHLLVPAIDVSESDNEFSVRVDIPGVRKDDVSVTVENGVLTISAERMTETEDKDEDRIIRQERRTGKYQRSLRLGVDIDESNVKATHKDGVLQVVLPKAEKVKPKRINIDVG